MTSINSRRNKTLFIKEFVVAREDSLKVFLKSFTSTD